MCQGTLCCLGYGGSVAVRTEAACWHLVGTARSDIGGLVTPPLTFDQNARAAYFDFKATDAEAVSSFLCAQRGDEGFMMLELCFTSVPARYPCR